MKIGIITSHQANNYGAVLQAVALKVVLDKFGETKIINYSPQIGGMRMFSVLTDNNFMKEQTSNIMLSLLSNNNRASEVFKPLERVYKFRDFIKKNANLTELYSHEEILNNKMEDFDVYVSGSDQIWNPVQTNMDPVFFSCYAPSNAMKISYASSTGNYNFNEEQKAIIKQNLSSFSYISTREEDTVRTLEDITGKEVKLVLDPTLLLNKKEWKKTFNIKQKSEQPYLLVYSMSNNSDIFEIAYSIAKSRELKIYNIRNWYSSDQFDKNKKYFDEFLADAGPNDFLNLFYNADYIVTDSFHGTIFSINFNKPFIAIKPPTSVGRITSILNMLGLKDRLVSNLEEFKRVDIDYDIDYENANVLLDKERNNSMKFLNKALNEAKNLEEV